MAGRPKRQCGNPACTERGPCYSRCHYWLKLSRGRTRLYCVHHGICHTSPPPG